MTPKGMGSTSILFNDALDRLLYTVWYQGTGGGVSFLVNPQVNDFVYDPQAQFLDMGVFVGPSGMDDMPGQMAWEAVRARLERALWRDERSGRLWKRWPRGPDTSLRPSMTLGAMCSGFVTRYTAA